MIGNLLNRVGAFLLLPLYTSYLSVADFGRLEMLYALTAVISIIFGAGLAHATLRFYFDQPEGPRRERVIVTGLVTVLVFALTGAGLVYLFRLPLATLLLDSPDYVLALELCLAILVPELVTEVGFAYLRAREQSVFYILVAFVRLVAQVGLSLVLVAQHGLGVVGVLSANLASVAIVCLAVIGYTLSRCGFKPDWSQLKPMLRYSLPMALAGIVGGLAVNVDRFLLKELDSLEAVGLYGLATKFGLLLTFLVLEPFYRSYGAFRFSVIKNADAPTIQSQAAHYLFVFAVSAALGIALITPEVLYLMATPMYIDAYRITPILLLGVMISGLSYCYETGILYEKRTRYLLYVYLSALAVKVVANLLLVPALGVYGAAIAFVAANAAYALLANRASQRLYAVPYTYRALGWVTMLAALVYLAGFTLDFRAPFVSVPLKALLFLAFLAVLYRFDAASQGLGRRLFEFARGPWRPGHDAKP